MKTTYKSSPLNKLSNKISRVSWPAIFAGALTALVVAFMLNLLGLGIGFSTINPMTESDPLEGLGTGTLIWFGISNLAALFVGGLVAGRMSGYPSKTDGGLHGFLAWSLSTIVTVLLITSTIGSIITGISGAVSGLLGGNGGKDITVMVDKAQEKGQKTTDLSLKSIKNEAFQLINKAESSNIISDDTSREAKNTLSQTTSNTRQALKNLNVEDLDQYVNEPNFDIDVNGHLKVTADGNGKFLKTDELKDYLQKNTQMSDEEVNNKVDNWEKKIETAADKAEKYYDTARQKVIKYSDKAAEAAAKISIAAFIVFFLGGLAAFFGGITGSPELTVEEEHTEDRLDKNN